MYIQRAVKVLGRTKLVGDLGGNQSNQIEGLVPRSLAGKSRCLECLVRGDARTLNQQRNVLLIRMARHLQPGDVGSVGEHRVEKQ